MKILNIKLYNFIIFKIVLLATKTLFSSQAVIILPVIDLIGPKTQNRSPECYNNIPLGPVNQKDGISCIRIHQLLFHEIVKILEERGQEVLVEIPNIFYQILPNKEHRNSFWTLKDNIISLNKLKKMKVDLKKFPEPINYQQNIENYNQKIVTLIFPFYDTITKKRYSAGTRFVFVQEIKNRYIVYIFNPLTFKFELVSIPQRKCLINEKLSNEKKTENFVKLLKKWANLKKGFIPYVWGGSSFVDICLDNDFEEINKNMRGKKIGYYIRLKCQSDPKTGFDCSGLILRAAQICQIPFYFKNTITAAHNLSPITQKDLISNGDLIWIPGHIIAITDTQNNLCVEARDYSHGYGKVHEIHVNKLFKGINNFQELKYCYLNKIPLKRINHSGKPISTVEKFKILKLNSVWHQNNNQ